MRGDSKETCLGCGRTIVFKLFRGYLNPGFHPHVGRCGGFCEKSYNFKADTRASERHSQQDCQRCKLGRQLSKELEVASGLF